MLSKKILDDLNNYPANERDYRYAKIHIMQQRADLINDFIKSYDKNEHNVNQLASIVDVLEKLEAIIKNMSNIPMICFMKEEVDSKDKGELKDETTK